MHKLGTSDIMPTNIVFIVLRILRNIVILSVATIITMVNGLVGHFFAPFGILLTPFVIATTTWLVVFKMRNVNAIIAVLFSYFYIGLNDILTKLYSGGSHDNEGAGFVISFYILSASISLLILIQGVLNRQELNLYYRYIAFLLFILLIFSHAYIFLNIGQGRMITPRPIGIYFQ